jgi:Membrane-associated phospholipid phosphatase
MLDFLVNLDKQLFIQINSHWTATWADHFFPFITDLHKTIQFKVIMIPLLIALFIWRRGLKKGIMIFLFAVAALGISDGFSNYAIKKTVQRPRPADTISDPQFQSQVQVRAPFGGYSFVSNHSVNMFCIATFLSIVFPVSRRWLFALAVTVGYSRIYNGVHFPLDVLGGAVVGITFGILMAKAYSKVIQPDEQRTKVEA